MNLENFILKIDRDLKSPDALLLLNTHYRQLPPRDKELFVLALMGKVIELKAINDQRKEPYSI